MLARRGGGFTLVEMVIAIVIISVGLAGVLAAFSTTVKSSADPMVHKQMLAVAEEMMEEILLKPYSQDPSAIPPGAIVGCNRAAADDVSDYAAYTNQPVCDIDGTLVGALSGYTVTVKVESGAAINLGGLAGDAVAKKIAVTVTRGSEAISLIGWRTNYAAP